MIEVSKELIDMFRQYHNGEVNILLEVYHIDDPENVIRVVKIEDGPPALPLINHLTGATIHDPNELRYGFKAVKREHYE